VRITADVAILRSSVDNVNFLTIHTGEFCYHNGLEIGKIPAIVGEENCCGNTTVGGEREHKSEIASISPALAAPPLAFRHRPCHPSNPTSFYGGGVPHLNSVTPKPSPLRFFRAYTTSLCLPLAYGYSG
jgi:hypothetical protein